MHANRYGHNISGYEYLDDNLNASAVFPISHGKCLELNDVISKAPDISKRLGQLRSSVKALCRIGQSVISDQYEKMNLSNIKLKGVKRNNISLAEIRKDHTICKQILPKTAFAAVRLRWKRKDLGNSYKLTCIKENCCFRAYSHEHLFKHLDMGHYVLNYLFIDSENDQSDLSSPYLYYPINPLKLFDKMASTYLCNHCYLWFPSQDAILYHYSM